MTNRVGREGHTRESKFAAGTQRSMRGGSTRWIAPLPLAKPLRSVVIAAALSGLLLTTGQAAAAPLVEARVGAVTNSGPSGFVSAAEPTPFGNHGSSASFGRLAANSALDFPDAGSDDGLTAIASFTDDFTITAPGATTGSGIMTVLVRVDGGPLYAETRSSGAVSQGMNTGYQVLTLRAGGSGNFLDGSILYQSGGIPEVAFLGTSPAPGLVPVEFVFAFGFPIELGFSVNARAGGNNSFFPPELGTLSGSSTVSLTWEGISSIRDFNGNELLGQATVVGASGTDWTASQAPPVPIGLFAGPAAAMLLAWIGARATRERTSG